MKGKITLLVGGAVGYVLGSRAGRQRYEQIKSQAQSLWTSPKVQAKKAQAQDYAKDKAPVVKEKATEAAASAAAATKDAAGAAKDKVTGSDNGTDTGTGTGSTYPTSASTGLS
jgi:hypothetical protein